MGYDGDLGPSEEWLKGRQQYIGASDVAGVLGLGDARYHSPVRVWANKVGQIDVSTNVSALMGHALEARILAEAGRRLGSDVVHCADQDLLLEHPSIPLRVHLDGLWVDPETGQHVPVEAKFVTGDEGRSWSYDIAAGWDMLEAWLADRSSPWPRGTVVEAYYCQIQAQMLCTGSVDDGGAEYALFAVAVGARGGCQLMMDLPVDAGAFRLIRVPRDDAMIAAIEKAVPAFWEKHVEGGTPPPEIAATDLDAVKRAFREHRDGEEKELPTLAGTVSDLAELRAAIKTMQNDAKALEATIRVALGDAARASACDWIITARTTKSGSRPLRLKRLDP